MHGSTEVANFKRHAEHCSLRRLEDAAHDLRKLRLRVGLAINRCISPDDRHCSLDGRRCSNAEKINHGPNVSSLVQSADASFMVVDDLNVEIPGDGAKVLDHKHSPELLQNFLDCCVQNCGQCKVIDIDQKCSIFVRGIVTFEEAGLHPAFFEANVLQCVS